MFDIYRNQTVDGVTTYTRPFQNTVYNPLSSIPSITIMEEDVYVLPTEQVISIPSTIIQTSFTDPTASFNLVDPSTGDTTGTMTFGELHIAMYSLYLTLAAERDEE